MHALAVENLRKSFGKSKAVVRDVSFEVVANEIFAFLGPNGAGKTTTIKMISGLLRPDTGAVRIAGMDPFDDARTQARIGAVLEGNRNLYWRLTAFENLLYFGVLKGMPKAKARVRADELLERFGLTDKRNAQVQHLSRGMQQQLAIAVTLLNDPDLLLLDEPTLGLDVPATRGVVGMIRELAHQGLAIVLTTHQLDIAEELSDRIAIMNKGQIIKVEARDDLINQFSMDSYDIRLGEQLTAEKRAVLQREMQVEIIDGDLLRLPGGSERLYDALALLRPTPVTSFGKTQVDLTTIFLQLTGEAVHA